MTPYIDTAWRMTKYGQNLAHSIDRQANLLGSVISYLNERGGAVSGGALRRNGSLIEHSSGRIYITVLGEKQHTEGTKITQSPSGCRVCKRNTPKSAADCFKKAPYQESDDYYIPDPETHAITVCYACRGEGKNSCTSCDGEGFEDCSTCGRKGYNKESESCEVCEGGYNDCQACEDTGYIEYKQSCSRCDGTGAKKCDSCGGTGVETYSGCEGAGKLHQYRATEVEISREFFVSGLDESWSEDAETVAQRLELTGANFKEENNSYGIVTKPAHIQFFRVGYGDDTYRVLVVENDGSPEVFWDPESSYPSTSVGRKLGDLKSRIF